MEARMHSNLDESVGAITGVTVWIFTHIWSFPMLQVQTHPIISEIVTDSIRLLFGVATAIVSYLVIHWCKRNITHEEIKKAKKISKQ